MNARRARYEPLLRRIHEHLLPRTYVEIGVSAGKSLRLAQPGTVVVGIDPKLERITFPIDPEAKLFKLTSDDFFARHDLRDVLGGLPVDLAFIDGMHRFEFALRDFTNLERFCTSESAILLHDCYPMDEESAARYPSSGWWSGDVWKLVLCLKEHRPDLGVMVADAVPTGLCVITNLDPESSVLVERYEEICERFIPLEYSVLEGKKQEMLNWVPHDWDLVSAALRPRPFRAVA